MESKLLRQLTDLCAWNGQLRPSLIVSAITEGHEGVEPIVAAMEFEQDQYASSLGSLSGGLIGRCRPNLIQPERAQ